MEKAEEKDNILAARKWYKSKVLWIIIALIIIILGVPLLWIHFLYPTTSPFKAISYLNYHRTHPHQNLSKRTIGFAPSWMLDKMQDTRLDLLSDVIFFNLSVDENGNFAEKNSKGENDDGYLAWNAAPANDLLAKAQIMGTKTGISITALKNERINNFLASDQYQNNLISSTIKQVKRKHLKLVNLDFEYTGDPPTDTPAKFTDFVAKFNQRLEAEAPGTELSIDIMARSGRDPRLFELVKLNSSVDRFIVMSYDYYTPGSDSAGPVAPINGFENKKYFFDLTTTYNDLEKLLPKDKIIMGIPYYGYDWPVKDKNNPRSLTLKQSDANGFAEILSYNRARSESQFSADSCHFDDLAQEPWCGYTDQDTGKDRVAWFENNQSLKVKYDFAKSRDLAGIAIWALGYDRDYTDIWEIMRQTFKYLQ